MASERQYFVTEEGLAALEKELEELKTVGRREVAEKIKVALSFGDLSENSEYDEAKNDQAMMEARIADLEVMLQGAVVIDESDAHQREGAHRLPHRGGHHLLHRGPVPPGFQDCRLQRGRPPERENLR